MYHAPSRIYWFLGVPLVMYATDKVVGVFQRTHLVENVYFERLGDSSCIVSFENPPNFGDQNSAYIYLMIPWLSRYQFHAFSVYPCKTPGHTQLCISKTGDGEQKVVLIVSYFHHQASHRTYHKPETWTGRLFNEISTPTHRPAFIMGPYLSPFSSPSIDCENLIAVATGIGITPCFSLFSKYAHTERRLNLVWICRDPGLVEYFLTSVEFDFADQGHTLVYYTGQRPLVIDRDLPSHMHIYQGRPNIQRTLAGIIASISSGMETLPENVNQGMKNITKTPLEMRARVLIEKALSIYTIDQLL